MSFISSLKQALIFFHTTDVDHSSQGHKQVMPLEQNCKWESLKREKTTTSLSGKGWSLSFEIHKNVKMLTPCTHARFWSTRSGLLGRLVQHFHIGHNAPGLPPKVYITIVFNSLEMPVIRSRSLAKFGAGRRKQVVLWSIWNWWGCIKNKQIHQIYLIF